MAWSVAGKEKGVRVTFPCSHSAAVSLGGKVTLTPFSFPCRRSYRTARPRRRAAAAGLRRAGRARGGRAPRGSRPRPRKSGTRRRNRSEEHTFELQSLMRTQNDVLCLKKKRNLNA